MLVRFKRTIAGEYRRRRYVFNAGTEAELPADLASRLAASGAFDVVDAPDTPVRKLAAVETAAFGEPVGRRRGRAKL